MVNLEWENRADAIVGGVVIGKCYPGGKLRPSCIVFVRQQPKTLVPIAPQHFDDAIPSSVVSEGRSGGYVGCPREEFERL